MTKLKAFISLSRQRGQWYSLTILGKIGRNGAQAVGDKIKKNPYTNDCLFSSAVKRLNVFYKLRIHNEYSTDKGCASSKWRTKNRDLIDAIKEASSEG